MIAYFIDPKVEINSDAFDWLAIQNEAFDFDGFESVKTLQRYILEAQRLSLNHLWIRRYSPSSNMNITLRLTNDKNSKVVTLKPGDELLLDLVGHSFLLLVPSIPPLSCNPLSVSNWSLTFHSYTESSTTITGQIPQPLHPIPRPNSPSSPELSRLLYHFTRDAISGFQSTALARPFRVTEISGYAEGPQSCA